MNNAQKIILIGGSTGAYDLIKQIIAITPSPITCAICIVLHRTAIHLSKIEQLLSKKYKRSILLAEHNMDIKQNHIYFAQPGVHLHIESNLKFSLKNTDPINYSKPSIDILFESCAKVYKHDCHAFLLSGANADGAKGLKIIKENGGKTFVQHPNDAQINTMPTSALKLSSDTVQLRNFEILKYFSTLL